MKKFKTAALAVLFLVGAVLIPTQPAHAVEIGDYNTFRWTDSSTGYPILCVDNHSSRPAQTATSYWDLANDLILVYHPEDDCAGYPENRQIDIFDGADSSQNNCGYLYATFSGTVVTNMNLYLNSTKPQCWSSTTRTNHYVSAGIGIALGLLPFSGTPPSYTSVMRNGSEDSVNWAQPGDRNTFDWYN